MCFGAACLTGLLLLWVGIFKPTFFWRSSQVLGMRRRLGDVQAQMLYAGIGALLLTILVSTYGGAFVGFQLLYAAIFGAVVFVGFKAYTWYRNRDSRPSRKEIRLQYQRQKLSKLLKL